MSAILEHHHDFASQYVTSRQVDVWLPPGYAADPDRRFPVLYMHDGQNLFRNPGSFGGAAWEVDRAILRLAGSGQIREPLVVGIWNSAWRWPEYLPQRALESPEGEKALRRLGEQFSGGPRSDAYLKFLVYELKPFIDRTYRTLPGRDDTFVMGSSMGGLISLYALCEYPQVFRGAGCLSTHWPVGDGITMDYFRKALPPPGAHRIYFDYGTATLDAGYEPYQVRVDELMRSAGYRQGQDWITRKFEGAEHSERAWRERVHVPLAFLLGV